MTHYLRNWVLRFLGACVMFIVGILMVTGTTFACLYAAANVASVEKMHTRGERHVTGKLDAVSDEDDGWPLSLIAEEEGAYHENTTLAQRNRRHEGF